MSLAWVFVLMWLRRALLPLAIALPIRNASAFASSILTARIKRFLRRSLAFMEGVTKSGLWMKELLFVRSFVQDKSN